MYDTNQKNSVPNGILFIMHYKPGHFCVTYECVYHRDNPLPLSSQRTVYSPISYLPLNRNGELTPLPPVERVECRESPTAQTRPVASGNETRTQKPDIRHEASRRRHAAAGIRRVAAAWSAATTSRRDDYGPRLHEHIKRESLERINSTSEANWSFDFVADMQAAESSRLQK